MRKVVYSELRSAHASAVCEVHRAAFPPEHIARSIFCSPGVGNYLSDILSAAETTYEAGREHEFVGAFVEGRLVGYAHLRQLAGSWHLNQVAVHPEYQGHGVGRRLVEIWYQRGQQRGCSLLSLDVDAENLRAFKWYQRLGFQIVSSLALYESSVTSDDHFPPRQTDDILLNWEEAMETKQRYGFAILRFAFQGRTYDVGWLGSFLKLRTAVPPPVLYEAIRRLPMVERVLLVAETSVDVRGLFNRAWKWVATTHRMQVRTVDVLLREGTSR